MAPSLRRESHARTHRLTALLLVTVLWMLPMLASAQDDAGPAELYHSDEFGYLFWWDASEWTIDGEEHGSGSDWVRLANDSSFIDIWGRHAPGLTAEACVDAALQAIESDPDLARFEDRWSPGTAPTVSVPPDKRSASSQFVMAYDTEEGLITIVGRESCTALEPGKTLLSESIWMLAEDFNENNVSFDDAPLGTVTLPSSAMVFVPREPMAEGPFGFGVSFQLLNEVGEQRGVLTAHSPNCEYVDRLPAIVVENTGAAGLAISPDDFVAIADGIEYRAAAVRWIAPALASNQPVTLAPGDIAILQFDFSTIETLALIFYVNQWGEALDVGSTEVGGCGGGAAPIAIDME